MLSLLGFLISSSTYLDFLCIYYLTRIGGKKSCFNDYIRHSENITHIFHRVFWDRKPKKTMCTQDLSGSNWKPRRRKAPVASRLSPPAWVENRSAKAPFVHGRFVPAYRCCAFQPPYLESHYVITLLIGVSPFLKSGGINRRYTPLNIDLSKKWLKFYPESALIVHSPCAGDGRLSAVQKLKIEISRLSSLSPFRGPIHPSCPKKCDISEWLTTCNR